MAIFSGVHRKRLWLGFVLTSVLALSVHAIMLQVLQVPYPSIPFKTPLPDVGNNILMVWTALWLYRGLKTYWPGRSTSFHIGVLFILLCGLNEILRGWLMNAYCATPSATAWAYYALLTLPKVAVFAVAALSAAAAWRYLHRRWQQGIAVVVAALLLSYAVMPFISLIANDITAFFATHFPSSTPSGGWCKMPYGIEVLLPAYLLFIEPTLACLFCVAFTHPQLTDSRWVRPLQFALVILALKKQLLMAFFYAIYAPLPPLTALASMGQFSLEAAVLGLLMALSWDFAQKNTQH